MTIFGKIQFVGEEMRLWVGPGLYYRVHKFFNMFITDGATAAASRSLTDDKFYIIQVDNRGVEGE